MLGYFHILFAFYCYLSPWLNFVSNFLFSKFPLSQKDNAIYMSDINFMFFGLVPCVDFFIQGFLLGPRLQLIFYC